MNICNRLKGNDNNTEKYSEKCFLRNRSPNERLIRIIQLEEANESVSNLMANRAIYMCSIW